MAEDGKPGLLVIGEVTARMMDRFRAEFTVHELFKLANREAFLAEHAGRIVAVATDGHWGIEPALMAGLPALKVVSSYGVGYDAIDAGAAAARGVIVTHTPDVLNDEVANTAIMLWLAVSRRLVVNDAWVRTGRWERDGASPLSHSAQNRRVGILGLGRIGATIARRAEAFGATVLYHSRTPRDVPWRHVASPVALAADAEVLICITPGGADTRHLVDAQVIEALGPEGILVNVSRGSVVDEAALVSALQDGRLGGAGLDVFENEPQVPEALKAMENVVLTPHIGSATVETRQAMGDLTCDNLSSYFRDGTVLTPVPECRRIARIAGA